jgi:hypothetical protein
MYSYVQSINNSHTYSSDTKTFGDTTKDIHKQNSIKNRAIKRIKNKEKATDKTDTGINIHSK